jgi:uncharacterized membrane protein YkvA (DUF1232 family)
MPMSVRPASTLSWYGALKKRAAKLKRQIWALFLAWKDPGTPVLAKVVIAVTVAYAVSPIDLIPDFIPVLGQLDDLVILPLLIMLAIRLIPPAVTARTRREAWKHLASGDRFKTPAGTIASIVFVLIWVVLVLLIIKSFR